MRQGRALIALLIVCAAGLGALPDAAAEFPITGPGLPRAGVSLASDSSGQFVVVYQTSQSQGDIRARRFLRDGTLLGSEIPVNSHLTGDQARAAVAASAVGFVVVWESLDQDGDSWGVFGQLFDGQGARVGTEFQVALATSGDQVMPDVGMDDAGNFIVVWTHWLSPPSIRGRRYDAAGAPIGSEFPVSDLSPYAMQPAIAMRGGGEFMVAWMSGSFDPIQARLFDATGSPSTAPFQVGGPVPPSTYHAPAADAFGGEFVVAWAENDAGFTHTRILTARFDAAGAPTGSGGLVGTTEMSVPSLIGVALGVDGEALGAHKRFGFAPGQQVVARRFAPSLEPQGMFAVGAATSSFYQNTPSVTRDPAGGFMVIWTSPTEGLRGRSIPSCANGTPAAADDSFVVSHDRPAILGVLANDSDPNGEPLSTVAVTAPPLMPGTLVINPGGTITVTPAPGFLGPVTFTYTAGNPRQCHDVATVTVDVVNRAPTPLADTATTGVVTPVEIDVLANDSDPDGDVVAIASVSPGQYGTAFIDTKGTSDPTDDTIVYQPFPLFTGVDTFVYQVGDDRFETGTAVVTVTVIAPTGLAPSHLTVDGMANPPLSDGNGVLEPGETVAVGPWWRNGTVVPFDFTGAVTAVTGPTPAVYVLEDGSASYVAVPPNGVSPCWDCYGLRVAPDPVAGRPAPHWDAAFDETLSNGDAASWTLHVGESFTDVPRTSPFYRHVETVLHRGVTGGCAPGTYCPTAVTSRAELAAFLLRAKEGAGYVPPACGTPRFVDVPAADPFCPWIEEIARRGVDIGCGLRLYCPGDPISRQDVARFLLKTHEGAGYQPPDCGTAMFDDAPAWSPACGWIEELVRRAVVTGCAPQKYCPWRPVTREQLSAFLVGTFGLTLYGP